jgi:nucleoside-diphosphate-sugar epimerase
MTISKDKMKIAIVGGSSFVGNNLIKLLIKKKIKLVATYNNHNNKLLKSNYVLWKKLDFRINKSNYFKYLDCPDIVINLAWRDIPNYLSKRHLKTYSIQRKLNYNLIRNGLKNLIVLGTCYEYGKPSGKVSEKYNCKPNTPYAVAKHRLLNAILKLKNKNNFKFTWLRPFFVYGLNDKRKTLFSIIKQIDKGKKIKVNVCGRLIRDFLSINYLSRVIYKVLILDKNIGILNVCSGKKITVKNFIYKILTNKQKIKNIDMNGNNPNYFESDAFWGNSDKLNKILKIKKKVF